MVLSFKFSATGQTSERIANRRGGLPAPGTAAGQHDVALETRVAGSVPGTVASRGDPRARSERHLGVARRVPAGTDGQGRRKDTDRTGGRRGPPDGTVREGIMLRSARTRLKVGLKVGGLAALALLATVTPRTPAEAAPKAPALSPKPDLVATYRGRAPLGNGEVFRFMVKNTGQVAAEGVTVRARIGTFVTGTDLGTAVLASQPEISLGTIPAGGSQKLAITCAPPRGYSCWTATIEVSTSSGEYDLSDNYVEAHGPEYPDAD
jgi:hypothetical protein